MKRIVIIIVCSLFLFGCSCSDMVAKNAVTDYLNQYNNLSEDVLDDLEEMVAKEDLTSEQKEKYKSILKKQYQDLKYEIVSEKYNGDDATITVKITVYDLYKAQKEASQYMKDNIEEFYSDDLYDNSTYIDYKLDMMKKMNETTIYTIDFNVTKKDHKWIVTQPSDSDLEKIHGIYNYEL